MEVPRDPMQSDVRQIQLRVCQQLNEFFLQKSLVAFGECAVIHLSPAMLVPQAAALTCQPSN
eukprot:6795212-Alexandrium_andersonii.AAC.1